MSATGAPHTPGSIGGPLTPGSIGGPRLPPALACIKYTQKIFMPLLPNGLGNVSKCIDSCSSDGFLVSLQQLQKFKADPHPLLCWHKLCPSVSNSTNQINTVLLYLLMSKSQCVCVCVCVCVDEWMCG